MCPRHFPLRGRERNNTKGQWLPAGHYRPHSHRSGRRRIDARPALSGSAPGQSKESMLRDIELGLKYFERVCVNIMVENTKPIKPDHCVIEIFKREVYPLYKDNEQVDILLNNTDFGVGV